MEYRGLFFLLVPLVFLITSWRLIYGVYILIALLPLERLFVTRAFGINIKLAEWMGLLCILVFVWNFLIKPKRHMFPLPLLLPLISFLLVNVFFLLTNMPNIIKEGITSDFNSPGFRSMKVVFWCAYSILLSIAVCYSINNKQDLKNCIGILLGVNICICIISLISMLLNMMGIQFMTWALIGREMGFVGIKGTFSEPAYFVHYMSLILPVAIMVFLLRAYNLGIFFTIGACFILLLTNYFSFSTTGLIGMTFMLILIPYFIRHYKMAATNKSMRYIIALAASAYVIALVGFLFNINFITVTIANYFEKFDSGSSLGRGAGREMALRMFRDYPIFGVGPGNWMWQSGQGYAQQAMKELLVKPSYNCLYWEILVDLGLAGFIPFAWFFISLFRQLSKAVRSTKDVFLKAVMVGFIVGFIVLLIEYYVCFNFYRVYVWTILGAAAAAIRLTWEEKATAQ